jgi:hypothetical protein
MTECTGVIKYSYLFSKRPDFPSKERFGLESSKMARSRWAGRLVRFSLPSQLCRNDDSIYNASIDESQKYTQLARDKRCIALEGMFSSEEHY